MAGRAQEAYDIYEEGIKLSLESHTHYFITGIIWHQARALLMLGEKDEGIGLARKVYWAFDLHREEYNRDHVRDAVLAETGVDIFML